MEYKGNLQPDALYLIWKTFCSMICERIRFQFKQWGKRHCAIYWLWFIIIEIAELCYCIIINIFILYYIFRWYKVVSVLGIFTLVTICVSTILINAWRGDSFKDLNPCLLPARIKGTLLCYLLLLTCTDITQIPPTNWINKIFDMDLKAFKARKLEPLTERETISSFASWKQNLEFHLASCNDFAQFIAPNAVWSTQSSTNRAWCSNHNSGYPLYPYNHREHSSALVKHASGSSDLHGLRTICFTAPVYCSCSSSFHAVCTSVEKHKYLSTSEYLSMSEGKGQF